VFPVCSRVAYLNAGTDGPLPAAAVAAARAALESELEHGRMGDHFEQRMQAQATLRAEYAGLMGCDPGDIALTTSASEGLGKVLAGMDLRPGDEILTSDQEHPGLIGPLLSARRRGVQVRTAPLGDLTAAVTSSTTLVACSHVGWLSGEIADPQLRELAIPVVLDGAQGAGAIPVDPIALGCDAYASAGQKWCCGADGTGFLYLAPSFRERVAAVAPGFPSFDDYESGLDSTLRTDARRHDTPSLPRETAALSLASMRLLSSYGWEQVFARARSLSLALVAALQDRGFVVGPRGDTTLVSFETDDPPALRTACNERGVIVRHLPGTRFVRASVGAWNDESDLERLLATI
jgi:selenocysteine lyase/cysteine desulfurase